MLYFIGEGNGTPLQYSCLENPMDGGAWWAAVHGVAKSRTRLSDFTFTFHFHTLEKEMATHSSTLAWKILGMGEPRGLQSMGLHRVGHDWGNLAAADAHLGHFIKETTSQVFTLLMVCQVALVLSDSLQTRYCNLLGSSVHGIFQARTLEWVAIAFSRL